MFRELPHVDRAVRIFQNRWQWHTDVAFARPLSFDLPTCRLPKTLGRHIQLSQQHARSVTLNPSSDARATVKPPHPRKSRVWAVGGGFRR